MSISLAEIRAFITEQLGRIGRLDSGTLQDDDSIDDIIIDSTGKRIFRARCNERLRGCRADAAELTPEDVDEAATIGKLVELFEKRAMP